MEEKKIIVSTVDGNSLELLVKKTTTIGEIKKSVLNFNEFKARFFANDKTEVNVLDDNKYDGVNLESVWGSMINPKITLSYKTESSPVKRPKKSKKGNITLGKNARDWVKKLIKYNYPKRGHPKWVNYDLFVEELEEDMLRQLRDALKVPDYPFISFTSLPFAYYSVDVDIGVSDIANYVVDTMTMDIPQNVIDEYNQ